MSRLTLVSLLVAVLVPPLLATSALRIVANDWIVHWEYDHGRVPADRGGLDRAQRTELAVLGLRSITPGGRGVELLREAQLPDGEPAFDEREVAHMDDVRTLVGAAFAFHTAALLALAVLAAALSVARRTRAAVPQGLRWGAYGTLGIAAAVGLLMLVSWGSFFVWFHELFFTGDSWRFSRSDTLLRLYPEAFWMGVGGWIAGLAVALAAALAGVATLWLRRARTATPS